MDREGMEAQFNVACCLHSVVLQDAALNDGWELTKSYHTVWKTFPGIIGTSFWDVYSWEGDEPTMWLEDENGKTFWSISECHVDELHSRGPPSEDA
jgi:hypothetical protein